MDLEDRISLYYTSLTKSEKKVYQAVLKNPLDITKNSIQKAADELNVSVSSIQRFVGKVGYSGYTEFKLALEEQLKHKKESEHGKIKNPIIHAYIRSFKLLENLDLQSFLKPLVLDLKKYSNVKSVGNGNTALSAKQLAYSLYSEDKFIDTVDTSIKIEYLANAVNKDNLIIVFSVTGPMDTYEDLFIQAKKHGSKTYLITMNQESNLIKYANHTIVLPSTHVENSDSSLHRVDSRAVLYVFAEMISYYYANGFDE